MHGYTPNWTKSEFEKIVNTEFHVHKKNTVSLDTSRSDAQNVKDMIRWGEAMGHRVTENAMSESLTVHKDGLKAAPEATVTQAACWSRHTNRLPTWNDGSVVATAGAFHDSGKRCVNLKLDGKTVSLTVEGAEELIKLLQMSVKDANFGKQEA